MNGILLVDKPRDWTSHDVVAKLRGLSRVRRIGHSGTLDPLATGLLCVFIGRATRAVEFAEAHSKEYIAGLRLGYESDTYDITGSLTQAQAAEVCMDELEAVLRQFRGDISQLPPMYSAVKSDGKRLYELARAGIEVERKPRNVSITALEISGMDGGDYILKISCTKGTYIRSLCHDIGRTLGCGGVMSSLRRTAAGCFNLDEAYTIGDIEDAAARDELRSLLLPVDTVFSKFPAYTAELDQEKRIKNGAVFPVKIPDGTYRVYGCGGDFLMLGSASGGFMTVVKSFFEV